MVSGNQVLPVPTKMTQLTQERMKQSTNNPIALDLGTQQNDKVPTLTN